MFIYQFKVLASICGGTDSECAIVGNAFLIEKELKKLSIVKW